jgi:two-component system response regulator YesN
MLADDERATREGILSGMNWRKLGIAPVDAATNGLDALEQAERNAPDILLTDIKMPKMNGIELAKQIRQLNPYCSLLIISGYPEKGILRSAIQLRAINFVDKPVELPQLDEQLQLAVAEQDSMHERRDLLRDELGFLLSQKVADAGKINALKAKLYPGETTDLQRPFAASHS